MRAILLFTCLLCLQAQAAPVQERKPRIVASFTILADMAHNVAGDAASVTSLVGPDGDVHAFEPSPADIRALAQADMLIVNGLGLEGWLDRLLQSSGFHGRLIVASNGIIPRKLGNVDDPHAWQSLPDAERYAANIAQALVAADPAHAATYETNARAYIQKLAGLDRWARGEIAHLPEAKRRAVSTHDALGYFAAEYGVTFIAPLGLSPDGDISAGGLAGLIDQLRARRVHVVFLENMSDPRLMRTLVTDGGAVIGGTLYSDALSGPQGPAPTFIELFRHNVGVLVEAMARQ